MEPESISPTPIGHFRVLRRLASGATTDVLLARKEGSDRVVALKVLLQQFRSDPAFEQMFVREAAAYARLSHPAIVQLYEFFAVDGQFVMVLEYVDGLPLHKLRAMLSIGGEKVEDSAALFIASRVFEALAAAHSARDPDTDEPAPVIHRDINPSNVLVPWDANVKVSDFGIAKAGGTQADTKMGFVKGTYGYLAPEQVKGENVTVRGDVYAASLLLWELLARRKAIQRGAMSEAGVLQAMQHPEFPSLDILRPEIDPLVRDAVRRGLAVNPDERSITAEEMVGVLAGVMKADEGRATLAQAIARVRPAPGEPGTDSGGFRGAISIPLDRAVNGSSPPSPPSPRLPAVAVAAKGSSGPPPLKPPPDVAEPDADPPVAGTEVPAPFPSATIPAPASSATIPAPAPAMSTAPPAVTPTPSAAPPPATTATPTPEATAAPMPPPAAPALAAMPTVTTTPPTAPAVAVSSPRPVAVGRAPRRDLALVVVLLSALVGVALVAFYLLWSEQGSAPESVSANPPAPSAPPSAPAPAASTRPAPVQTAPSTQAQSGARTAASVSPTPSSAGPTAAPPAETHVSASASPRVARPAGSDPEAAAAGLGDIFTAASGGGHRVFLDGRVVGQSPDVIHVRCGRHEVRVGGNGVSQTIDIPCGGSLLVSPKWPTPSDDSPPP